jgi:hypothetical protein
VAQVKRKKKKRYIRARQAWWVHTSNPSTQGSRRERMGGGGMSGTKEGERNWSSGLADLCYFLLILVFYCIAIGHKNFKHH